MANTDAIRWNHRYLTNEYRNIRHPRSLLYQAKPFLPHSGIALDVACGLGTNARYLIQNGLNVIGVDISLVALQQARRNYPKFELICADMENIYFPNAYFDVIINFYYLQRSLWISFRKWLKPGGLLIIETLKREMREIKPEICVDFLLYPNELQLAFADLDILYYQEGWTAQSTTHPRCIASLIARKPV